MTENPDRLPPSPQDPNVATAGTLLMVVGVLGIVYALISIASAALSSSGLMASILKDPALQEQLKKSASEPGVMMQRVMGLGWGLVMGLANGFVVFGGLKMRENKNYPVALIAAVVACVPCCFTGCCTIFSIPAGIFALMTLTRAEVKAAFTN